MVEKNKAKIQIKNKKRVLIIGLIVIVSIFAILSINFFSQKESFSVNPTLLKLNVLLQDEHIKTIKITNHESIEQNFKLYFNNLEDLVSLENEEFILAPKGSKEVKIYFKDNKNEVGVYSGQLVIATQLLEKKIPIMISIKNRNRIFSINQDSIIEHSNLYPGGTLGVEIKLFDMNGDNLREIKLEYFVKNFNNEIILLEEEDRTINGSLSIEKIIDIPKTWLQGDYVFITLIDYNGIKSVSGYLFTISEKRFGLFSGDLNFFVIALLVFIIGILVLFFYFIKTRDELSIQLKKQQNKEIKRNLELIKRSKVGIEKIRSYPEKKRRARKLETLEREIVGKIKYKQKVQRKEARKLRKEGKKKEIKGKLKEWEEQGFKMPEGGRELKKISKQDIAKQVKNWRKKGYK